MAPATFGRPKGLRCFQFDIANVYPNRPALAVRYAAAISFWSYVESWYANIQTALRLDLTLDDLVRFQNIRNSRRHLEELRKSAQRTLSPDRQVLFEKALEVAIEPGSERNDLVHGLSMIVNTMPDAILIVRPEHVQTLVFNTFGEVLRSGQHPTDMEKIGADCMSHALVYRQSDFDDLVGRVKKSERLMFHLWQLCTQDTDAVGAAERAINDLIGS